MSSVNERLILKGIKLGSVTAKVTTLYLKLSYNLIKELEEEEAKTYIYQELLFVLRRMLKHLYVTYKIYKKVENLLLENYSFEYAKYAIKLREIIREIGYLILTNKMLSYLTKNINIKGENAYSFIKKILQERPKVNN